MGAGNIARLGANVGKGQDAASNGLLNNLIAYWPGDEAAGNLIDAHVNSLDLNDNGTVTNNPGVVYATARQYTFANNEYHGRPGDDALLSMGNVDFTFHTWLRLDSKAAERYIITKGYEYLFRYSAGATDRLRFVVRNTANTAWGGINADTLGSPAINTWYMVVLQHDSVADALSIQVNNGGIDTLAAWTGGVQDSTSPFRIGTDSGTTISIDGRIGPTSLWKSAAGGGGVLTAAQKTALYAGGAGLPCASFTS